MTLLVFPGICLFAESPPALDLKPGRNEIELHHNGRNRTAVIYIPQRASDENGWPLVMMLHGGGGSTSNVIKATKWHELGEREGFVTIYPNGTPRDEAKKEGFMRNPQTWNSGPMPILKGNQNSAYGKGIDDVAFLSELLAAVRHELKIDPERVFMAGHSNGAGMSFRFAAERPGEVATIGLMAGHLSVDVPPFEDVARPPVSMIQLVGDQDPFVPLAGGAAGLPRRQWQAPPASAAAEQWARALGIEGAPSLSAAEGGNWSIKNWEANGDATAPSNTAPSNTAPSNTEVRFIILKDHGHAWAGHRSALGKRLMGPAATHTNATETMWEFFKHHPRKTGVPSLAADG